MDNLGQATCTHLQKIDAKLGLVKRAKTQFQTQRQITCNLGDPEINNLED